MSTPISPRVNPPIYTLIAGVVLVITAVTAALLIGSDAAIERLINLLIIIVPALIAAGYSEQSNKDIRNGVVAEKVKDGTKAALSETGVLDVVNAAKTTIPLNVDALTAILARGEASAARSEASAARSEANEATNGKVDDNG